MGSAALSAARRRTGVPATVRYNAARSGWLWSTAATRQASGAEKTTGRPSPGSPPALSTPWDPPSSLFRPLSVCRSYAISFNPFAHELLVFTALTKPQMPIPNPINWLMKIIRVESNRPKQTLKVEKNPWHQPYSSTIEECHINTTSVTECWLNLPKSNPFLGLILQLRWSQNQLALQDHWRDRQSNLIWAPIRGSFYFILKINQTWSDR